MITIAKDSHGNRVYVDDTVSRHEYTCFVCGAPLIPHKGEVRRHHFKHKGDHSCTDSWHGTYCDSEWHFAWQEHYPLGNREITLELGSVRHRADVIVGQTVVEFQRSKLAKGRFDDRNAFYGDLGYKVVWLFDLRDAYEEGKIVPKQTDEVVQGKLPTEFEWNNSREAFRAYDPLLGNVDLFFQLKDDDGGPCIVRVIRTADSGFEVFITSPWLTAEEFITYTGGREGIIPQPELSILEPREDYVRFRERYGIRLDAQQERAAQCVGGSTLLLAVPGSGKTTTMVARLGYLTIERGIDPGSVIAVTYGTKAADEMRQRFVRQFGNRELAKAITFCTINALCNRIYCDWCDRNPHHPVKREVIKERDAKKLLRDIYKSFTKEFVTESTLTELVSTINWLKNNMLEPCDVPWLDDELPHFGKTYEKYCMQLKNTGKMDFDDQLRFAKYALEHDSGLLAQYRERYRYWCVDEAQDTSRIQHYIIRLLAGPEGSGNVFMVGDEDQSIYGYRGAYPEALLSFTVDYPNARVLRMETNYRSGSEIVSAARAFIGGCKGRFNKHMVSGRDSESTVRVGEVKSRVDQFDTTFSLIREHVQAGKGALAVLFRNNETAIPLADLLIRGDIGFTMAGKANTFFTSPVVMDVTAFLRLALNPEDADSFMRVYWKASNGFVRQEDAKWACKNARKKKASILDEFIAQMEFPHKGRKGWQMGRDIEKAEQFASLVNGLAGLPPLAAIKYLLMNGYGDWLEENNWNTRVIELLKPIASHEQSIESFLGRLDFLNGIYDRKRPAYRKSGDITLATTHSSKGREFDRVIIIDAIDGVFPSVRKNPLCHGKDEAREWQEERRLFYVAMTRAKDDLILLRPSDEETPFVDEVRPRSRLATASDEIADEPKDGSAVSHAPSLRRTAPCNDWGRNVQRARGSWRCTPKLAAPAIVHYDVETWKTLEDRGSAYRKVAYEEMTAEITQGPAGKTVDLSISLATDAVLDVVDHIAEFARGCSGFVVHAVTKEDAQYYGVRAGKMEGNMVSLHLEDGRLVQALSRLLNVLGSLKGVAASVVMRCGTSMDAFGERQVMRIDDRERRILLSTNLYED